MATFERSIVISASREGLFDLMQDYARRLEWDPFLSKAELVDADEAGPAVKAWCVDHSGRGMETEYVSFRRPDRVAVRMTRGPWMFKHLSGSWIYEEASPGQTRVRFRYRVEARVPLPFGEKILEAVFSRKMTARLRALKAAVESGRVELPSGRSDGTA